VAKPRTLLTGPPRFSGRRLPSEAEILETADMVSFVFECPEAAALKTRFLEDAEAYRDWLRLQNQAELRVITYLLHLILRCPQLMARSSEFTWARRELEEFLVQRRVDPRTDAIFWKAVESVRKELRTGRPRDRALDFFRYSFIHDLMHPPKELESLLNKFKKTNAVDKLAEAEQKLFGRSPDTRQIWRSYRWANQFLREVATRMQTESSLGTPSTNQADSKRKELPTITKKRRTPATYRKSPRPT
jgi:hypothetical protein